MSTEPPGAPDRDAWRLELAARRAPLRTDAADRLVLLGTAGGSNPKATRCGYANAVVVGDAAYLVDCGEGVHTQLWRAGLTVNARFGQGRPLVRAIFVTHLHADHILDLPNLFQGSWPSTAIEVFGPGPAGAPFTTHDDPVHPVRFGDDPAPGIRRAMEHFDRAFATNINARLLGESRSDYLDHVRVHEIGLAGEHDAAEGDVEGDVAGGVEGDVVVPIVVERGDAAFVVPPMEPFVVRPEDDRGVTVSAILVQHAPVFPALAYRFDTPSGSVVFSGDTGPCENVVQLARGADYLVHEVIDLAALVRRFGHLPNRVRVERQLATSHTSIDVVGGIAERAGVGMLVLSHLVPGEGSHTEAEWERMAGYGGRVVCAVDLDELPLPRR